MECRSAAGCRHGIHDRRRQGQAGREITYQLADDRQYTVKTDAKGEVHFALPTRDFYEEQELPLVVACRQWNVRGQFNFHLATQGFAIRLGTVREVFIAGETFELTIMTKDPAEKPIGQRLTLRVMELTTVEGKVGERPVEEHAVQTADNDGRARVTLKLDRGGRYRLRAEGVDRWGNAVSGQMDVLVSDDHDRVRLRILTNRQTFKVGDTAEVVLHWRERPALALVTLQADHVLDYRLVQLKTGANKLPLIMDARLAPNFQLQAAAWAAVSLGDPTPNRTCPKTSRAGSLLHRAAA